jgi:hypothetical protein
MLTGGRRLARWLRMSPATLIRPRRTDDAWLDDDPSAFGYPVERMPGGQYAWCLACGQGG